MNNFLKKTYLSKL